MHKSPSSLHQNIVYLSGEFAHRFNRVLSDEFSKRNHKLTVEQFSVLAVLWYKDRINQGIISAHLGRDKTTIARVVSTMEKNKLIRRVRDPHDRRGKLIVLTSKGKSLQGETLRISAALYMKCLRSVDMDQLQSGLSVLAKMMRNMDSENI
jgi:MarR family transcriptional regulator, organic hydroperoxide resistance regulator